jgi:predicted amino acid-binding ACT domain protein
MMTGKRLLLLFLLLALGLSAFRPPAQPRSVAAPKLVVQWLTIIHPDGAAEIQNILKISQSVVQTLKTLLNFSESTLCNDAFQEVENSVIQFKQEQHGEDIWFTYNKNFDDLQALEAQMKDDFDYLTIRRLEIKGGTFYYVISWATFPCSTNDSSVLTCEWAVQMPGKVGNNNATKLDGTTLTWDLTSAATSYHFTAQSNIGGGSTIVIAVFAILACLCCLAVLLIVGGIAVYLILRQRKFPAAGSQSNASSDPVSPPAPPALS